MNNVSTTDKELQAKAEAIVNPKKAPTVSGTHNTDHIGATTKDIAVKSNTALQTEVTSRRGVVEDVSSSDILISKLYHQQALSQGVKAGKAQPGDFIDSITNELISTSMETLELIFLALSKKIQTFETLRTGKLQWVKTENLTPENSNFDYEFEEDGKKFRRRLQYNYFVLLAKDPNQLPFVLSMSATKTGTAKKLNTIFSRLDRVNLPSFTYIIEVRNIKENKDGNDWLGLDITLGKKVTSEQYSLAVEWYDKVKSSKVIVEEFENDESTPF